MDLPIDCAPVTFGDFWAGLFVRLRGTNPTRIALKCAAPKPPIRDMATIPRDFVIPNDAGAVATPQPAAAGCDVGRGAMSGAPFPSSFAVFVTLSLLRRRRLRRYFSPSQKSQRSFLNPFPAEMLKSSTIWGSVAASYFGQAGAPGPFGSPARAKRVQ